MYHAYFGLQRGLFGDGIAADAAVFRSPKHDQIIAHFKLAFGSPSSCIVLRGPAGVGKTTLTASTLRASSTRLALAWLNGTPTNAAELLELVLVELGINTLRTTRVERLQLWRQFQSEMRATDSRLFIVVERTEDLSVEVLHALDQLTAPDAMGNPGANVVLLGHATIDEHLAAPLLESLRQRIRVRTDLTPFTEAELQDYLRHQVACAGGRYEQIFAPGAVAALYRHSDGVTRLANTLCETALDLAASQQQKHLTPELVTKTAVSLLGLAETVPPTRVAPPATPREAAPLATALATPVVSIAPVVMPTVSLAVAPLTPTVLAAPVKAPPPVVAPQAPAPVVAPPAPTPVAAAPAPTPVVAAPAPTPVAAAPAPAPVAAAPARAPTIAATPQPAAAPAPPAAKPARVEFEFDGSATDISDVAVADFPVLTDAVELKAAPAPAKRPATPPQPAPTLKPAAAPRAAAAAPAARPIAPAPSRVETAYTQAKTPPPAAPKPAAVAPPAAPKPTAPQRSEPADEDDVLRQTQTMRAIAVAKSIDDISSSMAETLFGDAELDLVTAALASAAEWPDDDALPASAAAEPAKPAAKTEPAKAPVDDPFDLFGLGDDAPLELIDDSTLPPIAPKSAARR